MTTRWRTAKRGIRQFLYRRPSLYRALRPFWARAKWIIDRAVFRFMARGTWQELLSETRILVDLRAIRGVGNAPTNGDAAAEWSFTRPPTVTSELEQWLRAVVASEDYRTLPQFLAVVDRLAQGETFHGITHAQQLIREIASLRSPEGAESIDVWLAADGGIVVQRGVLRLVFAAARGTHQLSAKVIWRHPRWQRLRRELAFATRHNAQVYQRVLHPDLEVVPAGRICSDRIEIISPHLPRGLKTALDLGANFGQFSRWLEDEGYEVTAVEEDPAMLYYLKLIRDTMGYGFKIFPHDVRAYEPSEPLDILLALSVLHFFTKTEPDQQSLVRLLQRLSPKIIFFEPPRGDEYTKQGRFRIYHPDEFAEQVRDWAQLREVRQLGVSDNRRPVYLIR